MFNQVVSVRYNRQTGLGNKLFPWSRAIIISKKYNLPMLKTIWFSPRGAAITRGGIDYSNFLGKLWLYNNFQINKKELNYIQSRLIKSFIKTELISSLDDPKLVRILNAKQQVNICFDWNKCHDFRDLKEYKEDILEKLLEISSKKTKDLYLSYKKKKFIVFNIRCGNDFIAAESKLNGYRKTPLSWFSSQLKSIREKYGEIDVLIISDGGQKQLSSLLKFSNVKLFNSYKAIDDLLIMSLALELYGSGDSTFSAWGSFLGGMPTYSWEFTRFDKFSI